MCLLDEVLEWDTTRTRCRSSTHRRADNPLRSLDRLSCACGIEYAAQAMAVHGALMASATGTSAPPGFLASVRGVRMLVSTLDDIESDLTVAVDRVAGDASTALYEFAVSAQDTRLVAGRAAVSFLVPK
jgi:predicted hotdog family 3-hydroxylacyl-ACP dehydratase